MKYRINGQILFDTDSGSLGLEDFPEESLAISNPSKRLLLLLIAHHGEQVSRELIFRKVWDDYGMVSSNNNLNQCVSKLRRVLKTLGIDDEVIITVPKVGFMLAHNITLEKEEAAITPPQSVAGERDGGAPCSGGPPDGVGIPAWRWVRCCCWLSASAPG
ncbi:hypothetical protein GGER_16670 [Serratia rubidaea]